MASLLLAPTAFLFSLPHGGWWEVLIHASPAAQGQPGRAELLPQVLN